MANQPIPTPSWHSSKWHKNHPEVTRAAEPPRVATIVSKASWFGMGRAIALSAGLLAMSVASQIALAKGWADWIPNWVVIALYIAALIPIGYWIISHNRLFRHRAWIGSKLKTRPYITVGSLFIVGCILVVCLTVVSSLVLTKAAKHKSPDQPTPPTEGEAKGSAIQRAVPEQQFLDKIVAQFEKEHDGNIPTLEWVNQRLKDNGYTTPAHRTEIPLNNVRINGFQAGIIADQNSPKIVMNGNSALTNNGIGIDSSDPNLQIEMNDNAKMKGNRTAIKVRKPDNPKPQR